MRIDDVARSAHRNSVRHGFWDDVDGGEGCFRPTREQIVERLALIVCEATEAVEALRENVPDALETPDGRRLPYDPARGPATAPPDGKPVGPASELADVVIRAFDLMEGLGYDVGAVLHMKMRYNRTRPYRHGKEF